MLKHNFYKLTKDLIQVSELQSQYHSFDARLSDFSIHEETEGADTNRSLFNIKYRFESGEYKLYHYTDQFLQSFCGILGIPFHYAKNIPLDLLGVNVNRMETLRDCLVKVFVRDSPEGMILVNMYAYPEESKTGNKFECLDTSLLLEYFNSEKYDIRFCMVGDSGSVTDILCEDLGKIVVGKGSEMKRMRVGYRIVNPFTAIDSKLKMSLIAVLDDTNSGLGIPLKLGSVNLKLTKDLGEQQENYLGKFKDKIDKFIVKRYDFNKVLEAILGLMDCPIKYRFLKPIMGKIRRVDDRAFEEVFGIKDWKFEKGYYTDKFENCESEDSPYDYYKVSMGVINYRWEEGIRITMESWIASVIKMNQRQKKLYSNLEKDVS